MTSETAISRVSDQRVMRVVAQLQSGVDWLATVSMDGTGGDNYDRRLGLLQWFLAYKQTLTLLFDGLSESDTQAWIESRYGVSWSTNYPRGGARKALWWWRHVASHKRMAVRIAFLRHRSARQIVMDHLERGCRRLHRRLSRNRGDFLGIMERAQKAVRQGQHSRQ